MPTLSPFYFKGSRGHLFCQHLQPDEQTDPARAVLILPPFADEMNKSRRMLSQQCWRLAERGYSVYFPDLYGTGDSEGNFEEASWDIWHDDLVRLLHLIAENQAIRISVLAMRMGALLLKAVLNHRPSSIDRIVLWQPVLNGELLLSQFYRLKLAADMIGDHESRMTAADIKKLLAEGKTVEIAGYTLNPLLAEGLATCKLENFSFPVDVRIDWYEIVPGEERSIPIPGLKLAERIINSGVEVNQQKIVGAPFWSTVELVDVPELLNLTTGLFGN